MGRTRRTSTRPKSAARRRPAQEAQSRRRVVVGLTAAALSFVLLATAGIVYLLLVYPNRATEGHGETVRFTVPHDPTASTVADGLARLGVIDDPFLFASYLRLQGADTRFREGSVVLARGLTPAQVARRVALGLGAVDVRVTIPEGFTAFDVAARLADYRLASREELVAAMRDRALLDAHGIPGPSVEGYLFPDTYELRDDLPASAILGRMIENHRRRVHALFARHPAALSMLRRELSFSSHDVITLASIVEREAAVADERPIIAGVFLNRLRSTTFLPRQRLQADPTVSYGCVAEPERAASCAAFDGRITRAMLEDATNRYNTYRHSGLPPGPVANPGLSAIEAVLAPAAHDYLYFVARGGRRHTFSRTLDGHNGAVQSSRERGVLPGGTPAVTRPGGVR